MPAAVIVYKRPVGVMQSARGMNYRVRNSIFLVRTCTVPVNVPQLVLRISLGRKIASE